MNIVLSLSLIMTFFFIRFFLFSTYKIVDSEYRTNNFKSLKVSIVVTTKYCEIQRAVLDHLKNKNMCENFVKKLPFVVTHVSD